MDEYIKVADQSEIAPGKYKLVDINGRTIAIYNVNGVFHAIDNFCPHKGAPLNEGTLIGTMIMCPWHRWTFDVTDGKCITNPMAKVSCFELKIEGEELYLKT